MPRVNKIWFRKDTGWWMVTLNGKKTRLVEGRQNRKAADQKFHELAAAQHVSTLSPDARVADAIEEFLSCNRPRLSPESMRNFDWYGQRFAESYGLVQIRDLVPQHVNKFLTANPSWGPTTRYNAARSLYRIFSWYATQHRAANPLKGLERDTPKARERAMSEQEFRGLLKGERSTRFKMFLYALWATGARPKEARTLKWIHVRTDMWVLPEHKTVRKTKKPRVVYLNGPMRKLMVVLRRDVSSEFVFLNSRGMPWSSNAVRIRIEKLRARPAFKEKFKEHKDQCAYLIRHAFGTNAIVNGVDVATVAELMGHTSVEMVSTVYLHLADQQQHLNHAVDRATALKRRSAPQT